MPCITFLFLVHRSYSVELKARFALIKAQALQLAMLVHGRANPLLVRRDEEMQIIRLVKRYIQPHALLGICAGGDPKCCRPISFVILFPLARCEKSRAGC